MKGAAKRANHMERSKSGAFKMLPDEFKAKHPLDQKNLGQPWEKADVKMLRELAAQNTPTRVMGIKLGRTESSIRSYARKIHLSLKPVNRSPYGDAKSHR